jgi:hypothetical protein
MQRADAPIVQLHEPTAAAPPTKAKALIRREQSKLDQKTEFARFCAVSARFCPNGFGI